jgi:hypothetical protein
MNLYADDNRRAARRVLSSRPARARAARDVTRAEPHPQNLALAKSSRYISMIVRYAAMRGVAFTLNQYRTRRRGRVRTR